MNIWRCVIPGTKCKVEQTFGLPDARNIAQKFHRKISFFLAFLFKLASQRKMETTMRKYCEFCTCTQNLTLFANFYSPLRPVNLTENC